MFDFIGDLIGGAADLFGSAADKIGGLWGGPQSGGVLGLAAQIFGGSESDPWGILDSPVFGSIIGAVGTELLRDDPAKQARDMERARLQAIREYSYGLTGPPQAGGPGYYTPPAAPRALPAPKPATAAKYMPDGRLV